MTGKLVGYARVSSVGQSLEVQREQLLDAGVAQEDLFEEKQSGKRADNRPALQEALRFVRRGDTFLVTRADRLARSAGDLLTIVRGLTDKGVGFRTVQQGLDTSSSEGKAMLGVLAVMAELETDLRRERQAEGIAKAKAAGRYKGRPKTVDEDAIAAALEAGESPTAISRRLGVGRSTVYRVRQAQ